MPHEHGRPLNFRTSLQRNFLPRKHAQHLQICTKKSSKHDGMNLKPSPLYHTIFHKRLASCWSKISYNRRYVKTHSKVCSMTHRMHESCVLLVTYWTKLIKNSIHCLFNLVIHVLDRLGRRRQYSRIVGGL